MFQPPAIILAGGLSRRMGGVAKGLLPLADRPLLSHVVARLRGQVEKIILNTNDPASYRPFNLPMLADARPDRLGPLAGVEAAFLSLPEPWILTVPVDTPFLPLDLVKTLLLHAHGGPVMVASRGRPHPVICLWPRAILPEIRKSLDQYAPKLVQWFDDHPHQVVSFPDLPGGMDPFLNINRPADLAAAQPYCHYDSLE